jgi:hypothetical protein
MTTAHATRCTGDKLQLRSDDHTYNGWSNHATWAANLWITNDPYGDEEIMRIATSGESLFEKAEAIKKLVEFYVYGENGDELRTGLAADLLNGAIDDIDFREIAETHPSSDYE